MSAIIIPTQSKICQHANSRIEEGIMSFLKRFLNSTTRLICLVFLLLIFTALPALADECSPEDRVPLPPCVEAEYVDNGAVITNRCRYTVTIKVDIANGDDQLIEIPGNGASRVVSTTGRFNLKCCPKYNKCSE